MPIRQDTRNYFNTTKKHTIDLSLEHLIMSDLPELIRLMGNNHYIQNIIYPPNCDYQIRKTLNQIIEKNRLYQKNCSFSLRNIEALSIENVSEQIEASADLIREHADRRGRLFFNTLIFYYNTQLPIKREATDRKAQQFGSGSDSLGTQACHSTLLPTPSHIESELKRLGASGASNNYFYYTLGATVELPKAVNHFDKRIENALRGRTEIILNQVSQGEIDPLQGLMIYYSKMREIFKELDDFFQREYQKLGNSGREKAQEKRNRIFLAHKALRYEWEGTFQEINEYGQLLPKKIEIFLELHPREIEYTSDPNFLKATFVRLKHQMVHGLNSGQIVLDPVELINKTKILYDCHRYQEALKCCEEAYRMVINRSPLNTEVINASQLWRLECNIKQDPINSILYLHNQAQIWMNSQRYEEALACYNRMDLSAHSSDNVVYLTNKRVILFHLKRYKECLDCCKELACWPLSIEEKVIFLKDITRISTLLSDCQKEIIFAYSQLLEIDSTNAYQYNEALRAYQGAVAVPPVEAGNPISAATGIRQSSDIVIEISAESPRIGGNSRLTDHNASSQPILASVVAAVVATGHFAKASSSEDEISQVLAQVVAPSSNQPPSREASDNNANSEESVSASL